MLLHVDADPDDPSVWVSDVPEGCTSYEIQATVEEMALAGNTQAKLALELVGSTWLPLNADYKATRSRVFRDGKR